MEMRVGELSTSKENHTTPGLIYNRRKRAKLRDVRLNNPPVRHAIIIKAINSIGRYFRKSIMDVVTISRQLGSQGFEIAQALAAEMGYRLVWRELINQAAIRAGAPEVALAVIDELNLLGICPSPEKCQAYIEAVAKVIHELADEGRIVIVGRGGQLILRGHPNALHVRIVAPLEVRVERLAASKSIPAKAALAQIKASDRTRRLYFQKFYQADWDDPELYDLTINTARIFPASAVGLIHRALTLPREEGASGKPSRD